MVKLPDNAYEGIVISINPYVTEDEKLIQNIQSGTVSQSGRLESKALNVTGKTWANGTVSVDSTTGNDTLFVVTWTMQKPLIILQDPKGKEYDTSDFKEHKQNSRTSHLRIPGIAETGTWTYRLLNNEAQPQLLSVTMTTGARNPSILPAMAAAYRSQNTAQDINLGIFHAKVWEEDICTFDIEVDITVIIVDIAVGLLDNGAGADTVKNDGIYPRYFKEYNGSCRYSLKVLVQARNHTARRSLRRKNKSLYIPGYVVNGAIGLNPPRPEVKEDLAEAQLEDVSRLTSGRSFTVSGAPPTGDNTPLYGPSKITGLEAEVQGGGVHLSWTAPGSTLDKGKAANYTIRSKSSQELQHDFYHAADLTSKEAGSEETFGFKAECFKVENGIEIFIATKGNNESHLISEVKLSIRFTAPQDSSIPALGINISASSLAIWGLAMILSVI
ncbi:calcium-activated chloride channel regulator 1-like [Dipodomys spectabilis]|uniref:calcium-activated chloride channel regulator 1-like n=1 Tax=Dipodomys spectabilis TaxID=105255 RepID=UPI001C54614A|nr:calcium-activated chloride channel regulator 1-like [Dipodomys spectabilis]